MDEATQETAALDDNGDGQANVAKIVGPPSYWSSVGIEGPTRERVVSVDWATGFGFEPVAVDVGSAADAQRYERTVNARLNARLNSWPMIRIPAEAPESVVQHRNAVDVARHLADWMRTRITPGADPLAEWDDEVQIEAARELMDGGTRIVEFSYVDEHGDRINCVSNESLSLQPLFDDAHRDVPCDVVRWRDPKHRAAMTERAREYASHLPGRRA